MKITEVIKELQTILENNGDLEVVSPGEQSDGYCFYTVNFDYDYAEVYAKKVLLHFN